MLRNAGYRVLEAANGAEALERARGDAPDLIILDIKLPDIDGMEVCRQLRMAKVNTPILFLTALGTTENIVAGLNAGGDDYLVKPFKFDELEARLKSLVRRRALTVVDDEEGRLLPGDDRQERTEAADVPAMLDHLPAVLDIELECISPAR